MVYFFARLIIYAAMESISSELSIIFGIVGCEVRRKTLIATPLVEGVRLMAAKPTARGSGALRPAADFQSSCDGFLRASSSCVNRRLTYPVGTCCATALPAVINYPMVAAAMRLMFIWSFPSVFVVSRHK
jgi:hypothetical protein